GSRDAARTGRGEAAGEDGAGPDAARAARPMHLVLAHADSARTARLHRAAAAGRGMRGESVMPALTRMTKRHRTLGRYVLGQPSRAFLPPGVLASYTAS